MILFHPSSVGLLMADAQSLDMSLVPPELIPIAAKPKKTETDRAMLLPYKEMSLSAGAKTAIKNLAKEFVFGYDKIVETKELDKGLMCEGQAIQLLNNLWFQNYEKNTIRVKDEYLNGECDILVPDVETIDTKVSWDLSTFPVLSEDAHDTAYEWQGRGYMRLYNVPQHRVAFVLLDTPEGLMKPWFQQDLHRVSRLPAHMRVTTITYKRDMLLEQKMINKLKVARKYFINIVAQINLEHKEAA